MYSTPSYVLLEIIGASMQVVEMSRNEKIAALMRKSVQLRVLHKINILQIIFTLASIVSKNCTLYIVSKTR